MNQFEDMQTFVRIVESGSITKAAEQLNTAKSAVSKRLAALEERLGVTLLNRTTRRLKLTDSGTSYYQQSLRILDDIAEVESSLRNDNCALSGRIKIAAPLSFGLSHLGRALLDFNEQNPEVILDIDFNDRKIDLIEEGFDLAIRIGELTDSTLIARRLTSIHLLVCASPDYLARYGNPTSPQELNNGHVKLQYTGAKELLSFSMINGTKINIKLPAVMHSNNGKFLCQTAIEGKGILISPDFICYKAIKSGQLVPILTDYFDNPDIGAHALYPQNRHLSKRVRSLVNYLQQHFGEKPYWHIDC
ncbi:LysR family transcriptional regulator [Aliikangiella maris]|uniref:LysR family transcriptional regulator n=2 Tax=Aliikangiella maris TaxID=3162458 RepID=A0ABV2BPT5_9GAMM